jgi:hypothetical protein
VWRLFVWLFPVFCNFSPEGFEDIIFFVFCFLAGNQAVSKNDTFVAEISEGA